MTMVSSPRVVVVGSVNMDVVARVEALPRAGETLAGRELVMNPGGKGANQAVAAARLGAEVAFVGRVGADGFGVELRRTLEEASVDCSQLETISGVASGTALIHVDDEGENAITVIPGANACLTPRDINEARPVMGEADVILLQLEIPLETALAVIDEARDLGVPVILDPAPAPRAVDGRLCRVDVLTPNETEAAALIGDASASAKATAEALRRAGARHVVLKRGAAGAVLLDESGTVSRVPAFSVSPVDTTAAGDAFTAALAVEWARGTPLVQAVRFGCAAGALATTKLGAQAAMPTYDEVMSLLHESEPTKEME